MKRAILALAFLLLLTIPSWAQFAPCAEDGSVSIDTTTLHLTISSNSAFALRGGITTSTTTTHVAWLVTTDRSASGRINYSISAPSITFSGDCSIVDGMSTVQIFDMLAKATVSQGLATGDLSCPAACTAPLITKVMTVGCVARTGSDSTTHFVPCVPGGCCVRTYSICCPNGNGSPVITLTGSQSSGCTGSNCMSTCS